MEKCINRREKLLATDATPNYDANGKLAAIVLSGYGQVKEVKF